MTVSIFHVQEGRLSATHILHYLPNISLEYKVIKSKIDGVITENKKHLWVPIFSSTIEMVNSEGTTSSTKSVSSFSSIVTEVNERIHVFKSILFSLPVVNDDGNLSRLIPSSPTDDVKDIIASGIFYVRVGATDDRNYPFFDRRCIQGITLYESSWSFPPSLSHLCFLYIVVTLSSK